VTIKERLKEGESVERKVIGGEIARKGNRKMSKRKGER
jgi:hypothetical protein